MATDTPTHHKNPFEAPTSQASYRSDLLPSDRTAELMRQSRPWVMLLGVLLATSTLLSLLAMIVMAGSVAFAVARGGGVPAATETAFALMFACTMTALQTLVVFFLLRYASRIKDFVQIGGVEQLNTALEAQRNLWRLIGVLALFTIFVYFTALVLGGVGFALSMT